METVGVWLKTNQQDFQFNNGFRFRRSPYLFGTSRTSPNSSYSMWKTLEKEFCKKNKSMFISLKYYRLCDVARTCLESMWAWLHATRIKWKYKNAYRVLNWSNLNKRSSVICCRFILFAFWTHRLSFPPTKQLQLIPRSKNCRQSSGTVHTVQNTSLRIKKGTLIYNPSGLARKRVYFDIPALLSPASPLIGTCFLSTCAPNISQRILFPFLRGGDRTLKMDKSFSFWKNLPPTLAHTYTPSLCGLSTPWSI